MTTTTACLFVTLLCAMLLPLSQAADDECWSGSSNPDDFSYPPAAVDCSQMGMVCELAKVKTLNLYTSSCVSAQSCSIDKESVGTSLGLYESVDCCTADLCNAYPDQPNAESGSSSLIGGGILGSLIMVAGLGLNVARI